MSRHEEFHEIGAISGIANMTSHGELKNLTPANACLARQATDGVRLVVVGDADFTCAGGAADASIYCEAAMASRWRIDFRLPIIRLIEGSGGGGL